MKKGGNVHLGPYAKGSKDKCGIHNAPRTYADDHRMNAAVPKIKGHHFNGGGSRKTGKTFK